MARGLANGARRSRHGDRRHGKRKPHPKPRLAVAHRIGDMAKITHLKREALQETAIETVFGVAQNHRRVRKPGNDALGDDIRIPGDAAEIAAMGGDPIVDDLAQAHVAGVLADRTQMSQPAEGVETRRKLARRKIDLERRLAFRIEDAAGKRETPGEDFLGDKGIDGSEIGRRDDQAVRRRAGETQGGDTADRQPARHAAPAFTHIQVRKPPPAGKQPQRRRFPHYWHDRSNI